MFSCFQEVDRENIISCLQSRTGTLEASLKDRLASEALAEEVISHLSSELHTSQEAVSRNASKLCTTEQSLARCKDQLALLSNEVRAQTHWNSLYC